MVETITPVVHGGRGRWVALHVVGATLTAGLLGAVLGAGGLLLGAPFGRAGLVGLGAVALVYAAGVLAIVEVPVPQLRRQVPSWWRTFFSPRVTAFLYGAGLGVGFLTYLSTGALVVVAVAALVSGEPWLGAILLAPFGLARGLSAIVAANVRSADDGVRLVDRLNERSDVVRRLVSAVALVSVGTLAITAASRSEGGWASLGSALVAGAFGWAAISKIAARRRWWQTLAAHWLPAPVERGATWAVPAAEGLVPMLTILGYRTAAAALALLLLAGFSAEIVRLRLHRGARVPCGCFGGRHEVPASLLLVRNAGLAGACALAIAGELDAPLVRWPGMPSGMDVLPATLALTGVIVAVAAARQAHRSFVRGRA
jgi:hypothetical protein